MAVARSFAFACRGGRYPCRAHALAVGCADFAAMLGVRSRGTTRCAACGRYAQTSAASQFTMRAPAARVDLTPALLAAAKSPGPGTARRSGSIGGIPRTCHRPFAARTASATP